MKTKNKYATPELEWFDAAAVAVICTSYTSESSTEDFESLTTFDW